MFFLVLSLLEECFFLYDDIRMYVCVCVYGGGVS